VSDIWFHIFIIFFVYYVGRTYQHENFIKDYISASDNHHKYFKIITGNLHKIRHDHLNKSSYISVAPYLLSCQLSKKKQ